MRRHHDDPRKPLGVASYDTFDVAAAPEKLSDATRDLHRWGSGSWHLYLCMALLSLVATMNGYDGSLMGSINALASFQDFYGLGPHGAAQTGIVFAVANIGQIVGALFSWLSDWRGRRPAIFLGCLGVCLSSAVTATAPTLTGFILGRFLLATFSTLATTATPILLVEIAPPLRRGSFSGFYNTIYFVGSIMASVTVYGTFGDPTLRHSSLAWRLPLWLQAVCPALVCLGIFWVPESPRWSVSRSRIDDARAMITTYHANGDPSHPIVELQLLEIMRSVQQEGKGTQSARAMVDLGALVSSKPRRYRTMLLVAFSFISQFSGNNVSSYYLPMLVESVGVTSTSMQLLLNVVYALVGWVFAATGAVLHDLFGRRRMFLASLVGMIATLVLVTVGAAGYLHGGGGVAASTLAIAGIFLFGACFATGFTAMQPIYPCEVMTNDMRAKGMALFQISSGAASFINTFAAPVALANLGYWLYVFFIFWDAAEAAFAWAFFVETKGRTLEELDAVFDAPNPRKASTMGLAGRRRGCLV